MAKQGARPTSQWNQVLREEVGRWLKHETFATTIGKEPDIQNIIMALIQRESSINPGVTGLSVKTASSLARKIHNDPQVANVYNSASKTVQDNIDEMYIAWGAMQSMGWNHVYLTSFPSEMISVNKELAKRVMVNLGDSIKAKMGGEQNYSNQVLAGMLMLTAKYNRVKRLGNGMWGIGTSSTHQSSSRLSVAIAAYLGLGKQDVRTKLTPMQYVQDIVYGSSYKVANGDGIRTGPMPTTVVSNSSPQNTAANGPVMTAASGQNKHGVGC